MLSLLDKHQLYIMSSKPSDSERSDLPVQAAYVTDDELVNAKMQQKEEICEMVDEEYTASQRVGNETACTTTTYASIKAHGYMTQQHNGSHFEGMSIIANS